MSTSARLPSSAMQTEPTEGVAAPSVEAQKTGRQAVLSSKAQINPSGSDARVTNGASPSARSHGLAKTSESQALGGAAGDVREPFASAQSAPVAFDAAIAQAPLRIVGSPSVIGETRTLYEVAPGDTVLLEESENVASNAVGATVGASTAPQAQRKMSAPALIPSPDAPVSAGSGGSSGVNTIVWTDSASGKVMKLSGHHSRAELEYIRRRIEHARAGGSVKPKVP